jgi:hypothetical protein
MSVRGNDRFDKRALLRLTAWGAGASLALALAVTSGISGTGARRANVAIAALTSGEPRQVTAQLAPRAADMEAETRRLNEAIRLLAADRDRLQTRLGSLERNLDDMTGSIRQATSRPSRPDSGTTPASSLQPGPAPASAESEITGTIPMAATPARPGIPAWAANNSAAWPSPSIAFPVATTSPSWPAASRATISGEDVATGSIAIKTEFGVDIGGATNIDGLKQLWTATKTRHAALLNGLRPIVSVRESRTGEMDLRLIIGPLSNVAAAAKLCAQLGAAELSCQTMAFDGQRPALRW